MGNQIIFLCKCYNLCEYDALYVQYIWLDIMLFLSYIGHKRALFCTIKLHISNDIIIIIRQNYTSLSDRNLFTY